MHTHETANHPCALDIEVIAEAVRTGRMTAQSAVREAFQRIDARDKDVHAWVRLDPLAEHKASLVACGGLLAGVPFGVKDLIDVAGAPTALGLSSQEYQPGPATRSATAVRRLEAQGGVAIGKTVTTALALDRPGPTRNPLDRARSPGASSSGSAAAVAAGMVPMALGSQALGSVIRPASYCGVWAFVPSPGAVPGDGTLVLSPSLDRIGVFASTAPGLCLACQALLGHDGQAPGALEPRTTWRIGVLVNAGLAALAPEPMRLLQGLLHDHGNTLAPVAVDVDVTQVLYAARTIAAYELHHVLGIDDTVAAMSPASRLATLLPLQPSKDQYQGAVSIRARLNDTWQHLTDEFDAVLMPSAAAEAPLGLLDEQDPTPAALGSLLGVPAVNMPLFTAHSGMPIGCQLLARKNADIDALRIAAQFAC